PTCAELPRSRAGRRAHTDARRVADNGPRPPELLRLVWAPDATAANLPRSSAGVRLNLARPKLLLGPELLTLLLALGVLLRRMLLARGRRGDEREQLRHRTLHARREDVDVARAVVVARHAEVQTAVVGEDRDRDAHVANQRDEREGLEQPAPQRLQRLLRTGNIGDARLHAERGRPRREASAERQQHRRREARERGEDVPRDRLL